MTGAYLKQRLISVWSLSAWPLVALFSLHPLSRPLIRMSSHALSYVCPIMPSQHVLSCPLMPSHVLSCPLMPSHSYVLSCHLIRMSSHALSFVCPLMPSHALSFVCPLMPSHSYVLSCHLMRMSSHTISCPFMPSHAISCPLISTLVLPSPASSWWMVKVYEE